MVQSKSLIDLNQNDSRKDYSKSMYEEMLKPFIPKIRQPTIVHENYKDFLNHFSKQRGLRAKRLQKHSLIGLLEGIYSAKFAQEQDAFKKLMMENNKNEEMDEPKNRFIDFVANYIKNKWKSLQLSSQVKKYIM